MTLEHEQRIIDAFTSETMGVDELVFSAFRYYLGRSTIAVHCYTSGLIKALPYIKPRLKHQMGLEIIEAIDANRCGMDMDRKAWELVLKSIKDGE